MFKIVVFLETFLSEMRLKNAKTGTHYIQEQCCFPLQQLHSVFRDFNNRVGHVVKITTMAESNQDFNNGVGHVVKITTIAESNHDLEPLTPLTFCCTAITLATDNKIPILTMPLTSDGYQLEAKSRTALNKEQSLIKKQLLIN